MNIAVKVNTNTKEQSVTRFDDTTFIVKFKATREKGEANKVLIKILAEYFGVSKSRVEIISGFTSTRKLIRIN